MKYTGKEKISELVERYCLRCGEAEVHPKDDDGVVYAVEHDVLRKWAIAKNNNCVCINKGMRCHACAERIIDFEITEEELNG